MDNLLETLRDALETAIYQNRLPCSEKSQRYREALTILSDRSALLWALLEAESGECDLLPRDMECKQSIVRAGIRVYLWPDGDVTISGQTLKTTKQVENMISCLARVIQEQRKREAGVQS